MPKRTAIVARTYATMPEARAAYQLKCELSRAIPLLATKKTTSAESSAAKTASVVQAPLVEGMISPSLGRGIIAVSGEPGNPSNTQRPSNQIKLAERPRPIDQAYFGSHLRVLGRISYG